MLYITIAIRSRSGNKFPSVRILAFKNAARNKKEKRKSQKKISINAQFYCLMKERKFIQKKLKTQF